MRDETSSGGQVIPDVHDEQQANELNLEIFLDFQLDRGGGIAWFSPVTPARGIDAQKQMALARQIMERYGVDFMTGLSINGRDMLNVMPLLYDRGEPGRIEQVRECFFALIDAFEAAGYGLYRTLEGSGAAAVLR
jgi:4-cresol dehydrogenase (hydroxylating)